MSLIPPTGAPWDHGGIAEAPDPGTRPLEEGGRPTPPWAGAPGNGWRGYRRGDWSRTTRGSAAGTAITTGGHHLARRLKHLRRNPDNRVLGGVCGALSESFGVDVTWVRIGVVVLSLFTGVAILPYALAWLLIPMRGEDTSIFHRAVNDRGGIRLLIALIPVLIVVQIVVSSLHLGFLGLIGWPTVLAVGIGVLIWRNAGESERTFLHDDIVPLVAQDTAGHGRRVVVIRVLFGRARRSGRCGPSRHGPPLHHGGHPATGRRGGARHGCGRRSSSAPGGSASSATSSPSARPAPWPRSGRRWRLTYTTRCSRRLR